MHVTTFTWTQNEFTDLKICLDEKFQPTARWVLMSLKINVLKGKLLKTADRLSDANLGSGITITPLLNIVFQFFLTVQKKTDHLASWMYGVLNQVNLNRFVSHPWSLKNSRNANKFLSYSRCQFRFGQETHVPYNVKNIGNSNNCQRFSTTAYPSQICDLALPNCWHLQKDYHSRSFGYVPSASCHW